MLCKLCLLALAAFHAAAAESLKEICEKGKCGVSDLPLEFEGENEIYYLATKQCFKLTIKVSDDKEKVVYSIPADADSSYTLKDGCLKPSPKNTGSVLDEDNETLEVNLPLDSCDKVFFNIECFKMKQLGFIVDHGAPKECLEKALQEVNKKYDYSVEASDFGSECK